jgi:serine protease Do
MKKGKLTRSMLGVLPEDLKEYERMGAKAKYPSGGARVTEVVGDPGKSAGLQKGDIITRIGETPISGQLDLRNAMLQYSPGTTVPVEVLREGAKVKVQVKLMEYKDPTPPPAAPSSRREFRFDPFEDFPDMRERLKEFRGRQPGGKDTAPAVPQVGPPQLGVQIQPVDENLRKQFQIPDSVNGVVIVGFAELSVAKNKGYKEGDVVTHVNGKPVTSPDQLRDAVRALKWGDKIRLKSVRFEGGSRMEMEQDVVLG